MSRRYRYSFTKKKEAKKGKLSAGLAAASFLLFITAVHSSENNRKDKPERQKAYHISEYVRKYCKCAKLLPVYPEPSDFHKGNQIIPVYPLRLCRPALFL